MIFEAFNLTSSHQHFFFLYKTHLNTFLSLQSTKYKEYFCLEKFEKNCNIGEFENKNILIK